MIRKILRKILKIEQKGHPKFFEKERVYFVRQQDGHYEARNLRDGKVIPDYKFEAVEEGEADKAKSWKEKFFDYVSAPPPLTPHQQMREEYFRAKGIRASMQEELFCPIDPDERLSLTYAFGKQIPPDHESQIMLFDSRVDIKNKDAFFFVGYTYNKIHSNPYFNPLTSLEAFFVSSALGDETASCNISYVYSSGEIGEIDYKTANFWLQRAYDQSDNLDYLCSLFEGMQSYDFPTTREYEEAKRDLFAEIGVKYNERGESNCRQLSLYLGYAAKYGVTPNYDAVYRRCVSLDDNNWLNFNKYKACLNYARRLYIGLGEGRNLEEAARYLKMIPAESNSLTVRNRLYPSAVKLLGIIEKERESGKAEIYEDICKDIRDVYAGEIPISTLHQLIKSGYPDHKSIYPHVIMLASALAWSESWETAEGWEELWKEAAAQANGMGLTQVWKSTLITGPRYNVMGNNSLPILGAWEKPSSTLESAENERSRVGSYVPTAGISKFNGLRGIDAGGIEWDLSYDPAMPAMLVPEDFDVCLALVFGDRDGRMIMPSLSIEKLDARGMKDSTEMLRYKEWSPEWLAHTDFGRTLFVTDYLIGAACWQPEDFQIGNESHGVSSEFQSFAKGFVEDMTRTGGYAGDGGSSRVMLKPEHMKLNVTMEMNAGRRVWTVGVEEAKIRIDGSYILEKDGVENRLVALNDTTFVQGRKVQKLTDRYNDVSTLMPVFERARQMSALLYSLVRLKEEGFIPSQDLDGYAYKVLKRFRSKDDLPNNQMVFVHPPFPYPFREAV